MPPPLQNPKPTDVIEQVINAARGSVLVAEPAFVMSYNPQTQRAIVQPILHNYYTATNDAGRDRQFQAPASDVPVLWPVCGFGGLVGTLAPGDRVMLIIAGRSLDEWKATNAADIQQQDPRRHSYQDAVALPLQITALAPTQYADGAMVLSGADVRLGSAVGASAVALAPPTDTNFTSLQALLTIIAAIPPDPTNEPVASAIIAAVAAWLLSSGYPLSTGATLVKAV